MILKLETVFYMLLLLAIAFIVNTVLGVVLANKKSKFNYKKLLEGILKGIVIALSMLALCVSLELVPVVLGRININVPSDLISALEVILILLTAYKKYALDCIDKIKTILDVKESE